MINFIVTMLLWIGGAMAVGSVAWVLLFLWTARFQSRMHDPYE